MEIIYKNIKDLQEYTNNPRHNDEAVAAVAKSIKEFGFKVPIVIDKNNVIVAGHTRLKAAKRLKLESVPVIIADDLSDEQVKAFRLADNKVGELAQWDFEMLELELLELDGLNLDFEMSDFGFDEFKEEEPEVVEDDFDEENENITQRAKLGDIWQLGRWVYCKKCGKRHYISCKS
jgi:site-specific DNA-methyltransferase (adenine-specific)